MRVPLTAKSTGAPLLPRRARSEAAEFLRVFIRYPTALVGMVVVALMVVSALLAPILSPFPQEAMDIGSRLAGPRLQHLLGTDQFGRDILSRILYGARVSLIVGVGATLLASAAGVMVGGFSAFIGGAVDEVVMRAMDIVLAVPYIVLGIALVAVLGPSLPNLILAIAVTRIPQFARVTRGAVLSTREQVFVEAARAAGLSTGRIFLRHVLPNCITPIVVLATLSAGTAINAEAALSFLGLGIQPPLSSWGTMLADGRRFMMDAPWIATFPGLAISLTILGFNLLGDGLRDALDPRFRR